MKNSVFNVNVNTVKWAKAAGIRAVKTFAQTAIAMIPAGITIAQVDWKVVLGSAALAALVSLLTSVAGIPEVQDETEEKGF